MKPFATPAVSPAGAGTVANAFGRHIIRIAAADTAGRLGCFEVEVPAGEGPPPHIHDAEDEFFRVLEGSFAFLCNGARVDLTAGATIAIPRGAVHTFRNIGGDTGRLMVVMTPGGFEGFFPAVDAERPETPEAVAAVARRFHLRFATEDAGIAA